MGYIQAAASAGPGVSSAVGSSGGMVLLSSQAASNGGTTVSFTSVMSSTYKNYLLFYTNVITSTTDRLTVQLSTNNGSSYIATGYQSGILRMLYNASGAANQNTTTSFQLSSNVATSVGCSGSLYLLNMQNGGNAMCLGIFSNYINGSSAISASLASGYLATASINAIQVGLTTGTFTSGTFSLYGFIE